MTEDTTPITWENKPHPVPLVRKFALMNSGIVPASAYVRDAELLRALQVDSLRVDIGWGAKWIGREEDVLVNGSPHFEETDAIAQALTAAGVKPYWAYCYTPEEMQDTPGAWRSMADPSAWTALVDEYSRTAADRGVEIGYHEIYNEPDLADELTGEKVFFDGNLDDYLKLYAQTATAIKSFDPAALVGGPALGSIGANPDWLAGFLDMVVAQNLPLDFVSFHHYGRFTAPSAWSEVIKQVQNRPSLAGTPIHFNEYNAFPIVYPPGGRQEHVDMAAAMLEEFERLLAVPEITLVHWAQFQDSGYGLYCGLLDIYGRTKPAYWAFRWFSELASGTRLAFDSPVAGLGAIVTGDDREYRGVLWNRSGRPISVTLDAPTAGHHITEILEIPDLMPSRPRPVDPDQRSIHLAANAVIKFTTSTPQGALS